jgi:membrane dipeptidase
MSEFSRRCFVKVGAGALGASILGHGEISFGDQQPPNGFTRVAVCAVGSRLGPHIPEHEVAPCLAELRKASISCVVSTVASSEDWPATMQRIVSWSSFAHQHELVLAKNVVDLEAASKSGNIAVVLHCQGSYMLGSPYGASRPMVSTFDIKRIGMLHEMGVRVMQITDRYKGYLGDGCGERTDCALTDYGLWAVKTMNEQGIVVDCSEAGYHTSLEAISASTMPVVFSHSNAKALCPHVGNISDEQIRAAAAKNGVIGLTTQPEMLHPTRLGLDSLLAQIEHVAGVAGVDHVGIGSVAQQASDSTHSDSTQGMTSALEFDAIPEALGKKGISDESIHKVLGANFLRVFRQAWKG